MFIFKKIVALKHKPFSSLLIVCVFSCVICLMDFNSGDRLITLPCSHQYHSKCVSEWLKSRKVYTISTLVYFNLQKYPFCISKNHVDVDDLISSFDASVDCRTVLSVKKKWFKLNLQELEAKKKLFMERCIKTTFIYIIYNILFI